MAVETFKVGDAVCRRNPFTTDVTRMGTVVEVYQTVPSYAGSKGTLYAVQWDDTKLIERGYLGVGLQRL